MWRYLLLTVLYLSLTSFPLLTSFGANLEYEYALVVSYLLLVFVPALAFALPYRHLPLSSEGRFDPPVAFELLWLLVIGPLIIMAPSAYIFATGQCPCSPTGHAFWMALQAWPALLLAHAAHHGVLRARIAGLRFRWIVLGWGAIYLALLTSAAIELWFSPQKRLTHLLTGFLHGPIYDAWIPVDSGIALARASHAVFALTIILLVFWQKRWLRSIAPAFALLLSIFLMVLAWSYPSVHNGEGRLNSLLSRKVKTTNFTLHYHSDHQSRVPIDIKRLVRDSEFHVKELSELFGEEPPHVHIYVYPDQDRKKLWFGGGATDVADVVTPSIHITAGQWPHPTLRHELVHALASEFGFHGLGFHPNMAFTEGLAVALAPSFDYLTLDERSAAMVQSGRLPDLESLFGLTFWKEAGGRAYTVAGSILNFLIDEYGMDKVKQLYGGGSMHQVLQENEAEILKKWRVRIRKDYDEERSKLYAEALYRYPGVLHDICPHSKVDLRKSRGENVYTRLRQPLGWDPSEDYLRWRLSIAPDNVGMRFERWRKLIDDVAREPYPSPGKLVTWMEALNGARHWPPKRLEDVEMAIVESDLARMIGNIDLSITILEQLLAYGEDHYLGNDLLRQIAARHLMETEVGGLRAVEWRRYLAGWRRRPQGNKFGNHWLITYLNLRNMPTKDWSRDELADLHERGLDTQMPKAFALEWQLMLGDRLMRKEAYAAAAVAYKKSSKYATLGGKAWAQEHRRRALFFKESPPLSEIKTASH